MIFRHFAQILLHRPDLYRTTYRIYPQCNVPQFFQQFPPDRLRSLSREDYGSIRSKIKTHPCSTVLVCSYRDYFISFMKQKKETAEAISLSFHNPPANDKNCIPASTIWIRKVEKIIHVTKKNVIRFLFVFSCWITRMSFSHSSGNWNKSFSFRNSFCNFCISAEILEFFFM